LGGFFIIIRIFGTSSHNKTSMKKFALLIVMFLLTVAVADAQGFFKKVGKEAKDKTADRTESTVDKAVDKAFDALDNLLTGKKRQEGKERKEGQQSGRR
jgi:hypothetical protein